MQLGETIYRLRSERNMSQEDLAEHLGVSRQSVSKWENGNATPDLDKLVNMADLFGVTLDQLVTGTPGEPDTKAAPKNTAPISSTQKTVGIILLCFGILLLLMLLWGASLQSVFSCLLVSVPVIACGILCLRAKKHAGLYCLLTIYFYLWLPMGIFSPAFVNYNGARVSQMLHIFWGIWLIVNGFLLKKQGKFFHSKHACAGYYASLILTVILSLLVLLFPGLLPTPGLLHS